MGEVGRATYRVFVKRHGDEGSPDRARSYAVDADALANELMRKALGEGHDGTLHTGPPQQQ